MSTRVQYLLLSAVFAVFLHAGAQAQTTIDQRLAVTRNDGTAGGVLTLTLQVKATNLTGRNTLGSATIDVLFDPAALAYAAFTFPNTPSGISLANGYTKFVSSGATTVRVGVTSFGVNGVDATGTDLTPDYVTWATLSFSIVNAGTAASGFTIDPLTNQIGLFAQEGNSNGAGGSGNGMVTDQTLSTPVIVTDVMLPVELVRFTLKAERAGTRLEWKTATETDNAGFEVERADASCAPQARKWSKLGFVEGAGTCASERTYSFTVRRQWQQPSVYRLKQIDRDGGVRYSQEVEAPVEVPTEFALLQNYPNPFNPSTTIGFAVPEESRVSIDVYDLLGRCAAVLLDGPKAPGFHSLSFDASALASGVYVYRMTARSSARVFTAAKRFVLMR